MIRINRRCGQSTSCDECEKRPPLFDVKIGRTTFALCRQCLQEVKERAFAALKNYRIFLRDKFQFKRVAAK